MTKTIKQFNSTDQDLKLINRFTKRELTADEVFTFSVILCDNEIDRDFERFDNKSLDTLATMFVGKTGIFDHDAKGKNQAARIYSTEVATDTNKTTLGDPYTFVKAKAYMVKSNGNHDLMLEIDGGIKKEVSVSCSVGSTTCSVCGVDLRKNSCTHQKGKSYQNTICHSILSDVTDCYEWSFVAVPAQKNAGVTKAFTKESEVTTTTMTNRSYDELKKAFDAMPTDTITLSKEEVGSICKTLAGLQAQADVGKCYRDDLITEVKRLAFLSSDPLPTAVIASVTEKLDITELKAFKQSYEAKLEQGTNNVQLKQADPKPNNSNHQFKL